MRVLLDEMYAGLKEYFMVLGWDAVTVQEAGLQGANDSEVVKCARKDDLLLVTQDSKSAELAELLEVRFVLISNAVIAKVAVEKIGEKYPDLTTKKG